MLFTIATWLLIFILFCWSGTVFHGLVNRFLLKGSSSEFLDIYESYFFGLVITSIFSGYASLIVPVNLTTLVFWVLIIGLLSIVLKVDLASRIRDFLKEARKFNFLNYILLVLVLAFIAYIGSDHIVTYDTGLYHSQSIKWIRRYPVIPGLGNLHGRFGFNSMFFPLNALFAVDLPSLGSYKNVLMYPVNGISFIVVLFKIFFFIKKHLIHNVTKAFIGIVLFYLSVFFLTKDANSATNDVICGVLTMFVFLTVMDYDWNNITKSQYLVLSSVILICVSYKLSTLLFPLILIPYLVSKRNIDIQKVLITIAIGVLIMLPFLVRNYMITGYLLYPLPELDIFNVDWKIPANKVAIEKYKVEAWAKIPRQHYKKVIEMSYQEWVPIWFNSNKKGLLLKMLLVGNLFSVVLGIYYLIRKKYKSLIILSVIIVNLLFWVTRAPGPRFVYGFLFVGFALLVAELMTLMALPLKKFKIAIPIIIIGSLFIIKPKDFSVRYKYKKPIERMQKPKNKKRLLVSEYRKTPNLESHKTNFIYYSPVKGAYCYNTDKPCTPFPDDDLVLRKENIEGGFMIRQTEK